MSEEKLYGCLVCMGQEKGCGPGYCVRQIRSVAKSDDGDPNTDAVLGGVNLDVWARRFLSGAPSDLYRICIDMGGGRTAALSLRPIENAVLRALGRK
jgi:hypothetical protein